ncbi:hypothetical protein H0R92_02570 [Treponema sp. OMZ 840]|uniref:hypothetical protein n=1 Tax=Treponema sp. OMZ 840 TaxID=244313 RepID=UPI003D8EEB1D
MKKRLKYCFFYIFFFVLVFFTVSADDIADDIAEGEKKGFEFVPSFGLSDCSRLLSESVFSAELNDFSDIAVFYELHNLWNSFFDIYRTDSGLKTEKALSALNTYKTKLRSAIETYVRMPQTENTHLIPFIVSEILFYTDFVQKNTYLNIPADEDFSGFLKTYSRILCMKEVPLSDTARALFSFLQNKQSEQSEQSEQTEQTEQTEAVFEIPSQGEQRSLLLHAFFCVERLIKAGGPSIKNIIEFSDNPAAVYVLCNFDTYEEAEKKWQSTIDEYGTVFGNPVSRDIKPHSRAVYTSRFLVERSEYEGRLYGFNPEKLLPSKIGCLYAYVKNAPVAVQSLPLNDLDRLNRFLNYVSVCGFLYVSRINALAYRGDVQKIL